MAGAGLVYGYRRAWLRRDVLAGLATAAVVLPQAIAYAAIAGLPVQVGLYCALVPMTVYALLGTSRPLSVSTTSTVSLLTGTTVATIDADAVTAALTLAVLTGAVLLAAGALRMGFLADFVPRSVIAGLKIGMAFVIAASQLGKVLGVPVAGDGFFDRIASAVSLLGRVDPLSVAVAAGTIGLLLVLRVRPRWPGPLIAVAAAVAVSAVFDLDAHGVAVIGAVPEGLPPPRLPDLGLVADLMPAALGVAMIAFLESTTAARIFRGRGDPPLNPDRELLVIGLANAAGGFFQTYPASGGMSQTAVNDTAGARSQGAALVTAGCSAAVLVALSPLIAPLPQAALGGLVMVIAVGLVDPGAITRIARFRRVELLIALAALAGAVVLGPLVGVLVSTLLALLVVLYQTDNPPIYLTPAVAGLVVVRVEARLYFANAHRIADRIDDLVDRVEPKARVLLLDLSAVPDIDLTASDALEDLHDRLDRRGIALWFAGLNLRPAETLRKTGRWQQLTADHRRYDTVPDAVAAFRLT